MIKASVYVICCNEQNHIGRLLKSITDFEEVILVDSGSHDETLTIAKQFSNVKIVHHDWVGYAQQKAYALSLCSHDWVLNLDADEEVSNLLKEEIIQSIKDNDCDALSSRLCDTFLGIKPHSWTKHHDKIRFFKKEFGFYDPTETVHESIKIKGHIKKGRGEIYHYGLSSISITVQKNNQYSDLAAQRKFNSGKKSSKIKVILSFPFAFFKAYILRRYCLDGLRGFIYCINIAYYAFQKEAKLYEHCLKHSSYTN